MMVTVLKMSPTSQIVELPNRLQHRCMRFYGIKFKIRKYIRAQLDSPYLTMFLILGRL